MHNAMARVTSGVAVNMGVSYEGRRLEASLYRFRDVSLSCSMRLGWCHTSGCMSGQPRF
jgi:hypothetical protein